MYINEIVSKICSGKHENLKSLHGKTLLDIWTSIQTESVNDKEAFRLMGNFFEVVANLSWFLQLRNIPGRLYNFRTNRAITKIKDIKAGKGGGRVDICFKQYIQGENGFEPIAVYGFTSKFKKKETLSKGTTEIEGVTEGMRSTFGEFSPDRIHCGMVVRSRSQVNHLFSKGDLPRDIMVEDFTDISNWWQKIDDYLLSKNWNFNLIENELNSTFRTVLSFRNEQLEAVTKAVDYFYDGGKDFLINAKPRFGKIITAYEIAKRINAAKVLILTFLPSVDGQWREDAMRFTAFAEYDYVSASEYDANTPMPIGDEKTFYFASFQDFKKHELKGRWQNFIGIQWDLIITDEFHFGVESYDTAKLLDALNYRHHLALSGTPIKALLRGTFNVSNTYTWQYHDEQRKKRQELAAGIDWNNPNNQYQTLPTMSIHLMHISDDLKSSILSNYTDMEGFTLKKMFRVAKDGKYENENAIRNFLKRLIGAVGRPEYFSPWAMPGIHGGMDHTVWFMPDVKSTEAMENLLLRMPEFADFKVLSVNCQKFSARRVVDMARKVTTENNKSITLTFNQLNTGSTVPRWNGVLMLTDTESPEKYIQSIFRCQTPDPSNFKEECHVFDFDPKRAVQFIWEYCSQMALNEDTADIIRQFLANPNTLLLHTENTMEAVSTEEYFGMFGEWGDHSRVYGSKNAIRIENINEDMYEIFNSYSASTKDTISLNGNGIEKGQNTAIVGGGKETKEQKQNAEKALIEKIQTVLRQIPTLGIITGKTFNEILADCEVNATLKIRYEV